MKGMMGAIAYAHPYQVYQSWVSELKVTSWENFLPTNKLKNKLPLKKLINNQPVQSFQQSLTGSVNTIPYASYDAIKNWK